MPAVVDLSDGTKGLELDTPEEALDPLSSLSALASALDMFDDVPAFLNSLIAPHLPPQLPTASEPLKPELAPIDKQLNDLLTRLSLLSQDTSSALEQSIHDVSRTVPRLTYDLQFMRESAVSLQGSLQLVQDRVARQAASTTSPTSSTFGKSASADSDETRTHNALERLAYLDKLKTRMEAARDVLAEAESWSALESEITSFIADKQWLMAGERLAEASKSLRVFQSAEGEYESKRSLLVSLQNELETALSTALKDAIARVDTPACASFHDIFRMMDRGSEFQNYYFGARRTPILDTWSKAVISDTDDERDETVAEPEAFNIFLPAFFSTFLDTINSEVNHIPLIFPSQSASSILAQFIQSTLDELSPSFHSRLSGLAEHYVAEALPELIRSFKATEEFGVAVQGVMDKLAFNTMGGLPSSTSSASFTGGAPVQSPSSPSVQGPKLTRTPTSASTRLSMSHRFSRSMSMLTVDGGTNSAQPSPWETTLYEPFLDLQSTYPTLEKRYLSNLLRHDPALVGPVNMNDPSRTLTERATAVFTIGEEAIQRCMAFTHGYGALGLVEALNYLVQTFLSDNTGLLEDARIAARSTSGGHDELDFDGLDYSTEDWGAFQLGLHVLESCRGVRDRLAEFESKLTLALAGIAPVLNVNAGDTASLSMTPPGTTVGAITLLQQSTLNSADLHSTITALSSPSRPQHELKRAREALSNFTSASQVFLQGIILSPLQSQLESYPTLSVWSQPDKAPRRGELQVPTFSLSPTDTIARVAEGLLNLLRVFEVYAADDALAFSIETLPFVDVESLRELLSAPKPDALTDATTPSRPSTPPGLSAEVVLSMWVSSLALSLLSHLTRVTLPTIRSLSTTGAAQLASDLGYLSNAVRALDVEWDDLERWREAAECKDQQEWREKAGEEVKKGVWAVVGMLRGWN